VVAAAAAAVRVRVPVPVSSMWDHDETWNGGCEPSACVTA